MIVLVGGPCGIPFGIVCMTCTGERISQEQSKLNSSILVILDISIHII